MGAEWKDTVAGRCRYGDHATQAFPGLVLFEDAEDDYQGFAWVLVRLNDGRFALYDWTYGSCPGCDEWESASLTDEQIVKTMQDAAVYYDTWDEVRRLCGLDVGSKGDVRIPSANDPTNGSIPGMLHRGFGGIGTSFEKMVAFVSSVDVAGPVA